MKVSYDLAIEQSQKLVMTPELIQAIQILQFNTQELDAYVEEQLQTNPVLEAGPEEQAADSRAEKGGEADGDDWQAGQPDPQPWERPDESGTDPAEFDWQEYLREREYDDISYRQWEHPAAPREYTYEQFAGEEISLTEHLLFQLQFTDLKKSCKQVGKYVIESLDPNGYLTQSAEEIAQHLNIPACKVKLAIKAVQGFDPAGVGAANLQECLLIQLEHLGLKTEAITAVVNEHLEDLANNRLSAISRALNLSPKEAQRIADLIKSLEPKPGRQFGPRSETRYIIPDVTVEKVDGEYMVSVNDSSAPKLHVSPYYREILGSSDKESSISQFLTGRLNSALWLIKSIEQRRQTIQNVACAVVKYQADFFDHGPKHLKTLTLKQIADEVGIHESTVSRSVNGKYMQSPRGVFELKFFFTSGVPGGTGEGMASESVKTFIKEMIASEDPAAPLSDQAIAEALCKKGIAISRRTVAKYRDEMKVASSAKRRRY